MNEGDRVVLDCPVPCNDGMCPGCPQTATVHAVNDDGTASLNTHGNGTSRRGWFRVPADWIKKAQR